VECQERCLSVLLTLLVAMLNVAPIASRLSLQTNLVRESENMVRDTTTGLERATGELEDLVVCSTDVLRTAS
jgi:hypothetical protein